MKKYKVVLENIEIEFYEIEAESKEEAEEIAYEGSDSPHRVDTKQTEVIDVEEVSGQV